jgi:hypothetical protein
MSKSTSAERPSLETSPPPVNGVLTLTTYWALESLAASSLITDLNSGSLIVSVWPWIRTCSSFGRRPWLYSTCSAACDSPENWSAPWILF